MGCVSLKDTENSCRDVYNTLKSTLICIHTWGLVCFGSKWAHHRADSYSLTSFFSWPVNIKWCSRCETTTVGLESNSSPSYCLQLNSIIFTDASEELLFISWLCFFFLSQWYSRSLWILQGTSKGKRSPRAMKTQWTLQMRSLRR